MGYSLDLQKRYRQSKWLESIGRGAMIRSQDQVSYDGGVYALQHQLGATIHPGGKTALSILGKAHYLELAAKTVTLFGRAREKLPVWFRKYDWGVKMEYHQSSFLPEKMGLVEVEFKNFSIEVSSAARALMECLYLAPTQQDLLECYEVMESLNSLRPSLVQLLLERCNSVKVKRLFLYMAEKAGHSWFQYIDLQNVYIGKGKRSIVSKGVYITKYQITVARELENYGKRNV